MDLAERDRQFTDDDVLRVARSLRASAVVETSAKTGINVSLAFELVVQALLRSDPALDMRAELANLRSQRSYAKSTGRTANPLHWAQLYRWNAREKQLKAQIQQLGGSEPQQPAAKAAASAAVPTPTATTASAESRPRPPSLSVLPSAVYADFVRMFDQDAHSDCAIVVHGRRIRCHRVLLALRSAHFRTLFGADNRLR